MSRIITPKNLIWLSSIILLTGSLLTILYCNGHAVLRVNAVASDPNKYETIRRVKPTTTLDRIKAKGVLTALTRYNANSYFIYHGQLMGYDYELLKLLAGHLGVELRIITPNGWDEMFSALESGAGDIIATNLAVGPQPATDIVFTDNYNITRQVLVQRKPADGETPRSAEPDQSAIHDPAQLIGKTVVVRQNSPYYQRLRQLSRQLGGVINIQSVSDTVDAEDLIREVALGLIDYTVANENVARLNQAYYRNLDVATGVSDPQPIAWAVRKDSPGLLAAVNSWLDKMKSKHDPTFNVIYNKYYRNKQAFAQRLSSEYFSKNGGKISDFDGLFKKNARRLGWDWRLLAAQAFQESKFKVRTKSDAGAVGLMQLLPRTGEYFGAINLVNPRENIRAAAGYLKWLDNYWHKEIPDVNERLKFVLASYNAGQGHIQDARRLAIKYGYNPNIWDNSVALFLLKKSEKLYYLDPVVRFGYCRGDEAYNYVRAILERYDHYKTLT